MRELNRPLTKRDQILQRVLGNLSLFDAVPFWLFPIPWPRVRCALLTLKRRKEAEQISRSSLIVSEC